MPVSQSGRCTRNNSTCSRRSSRSDRSTLFLSWAAEPKLEERRQTGVMVMLVLIVLSVMLYYVKHKVWANVH
jgi:hypothetical protein